MKAKKHPEYLLESKRLSDTLSEVSQQIEKNSHRKYTGGNEHADMALMRFVEEKSKSWKQTQDDPYFGRIDFLEDNDGKPQEIYIGYRQIELDGWMVCDWRAPISSLFYSSLTERQAYKSPDGIIAGRMLLKRRFDIKDKQLNKILDEIDRRVKKVETVEFSSSDHYLLQHLYSRGDPRLQDIVQTIQHQQDKIIRAPVDRVLIINGVAGSGKTSIAYHRLAYLLYPDNNTKFKARNTIIFGPNRLFLSYSRDLLPGLGIDAVAQMSFDDWVLERMGFVKDNYKVGEIALDILLDPNSSQQERTNHSERARLKGSFKMKMLIDKFVRFRQNAISIPIQGLSYSKLSRLNLNVSLSHHDVKTAHKDAISQNLPSGKQRERMAFVLKSKILDLLVNKYKIYEKYNNRDQRERIVNEIMAELDKRLKKDINDMWPRINLPKDYYKFLSNRRLLQDLQVDLMTLEELSLLSLIGKPKPKILDLEDIAALYYLHILENGRPEVTYDHIVIDEAQDLSPLQFYLLQMHNPSESMTILGDISQGIYAHRGISDWNEVKSIFKTRPKYEEITQNYRSTYQIVNFTNEVLKQVRKDKKIILAQPFSRVGEKPTIVEATDQEEMFKAVAEDIELLKSESVSNIAIIVKTASECKEAVSYLKKYRVLVTDIISSRDTEFQYNGGIVVLPASLAKGIEFEAVFVVNTDTKHYAGNIENDGSLLYVAVTRALHYLNLYFVGSISPFLVLAQNKAEWRSKTKQMEWKKRFTLRQRRQRKGKIDPNEDKMLEEDWMRMSIAEKERTERNMPRRDYDGTFVSPPLYDDYSEDSSA